MHGGTGARMLLHQCEKHWISTYCEQQELSTGFASNLQNFLYFFLYFLHFLFFFFPSSIIPWFSRASLPYSSFLPSSLYYTNTGACPGRCQELLQAAAGGALHLGLCAATKPWALQHPWNAPVIGTCSVVLVWHWLNPKLLTRMNGLWLYLCSTEDFLNAFFFVVFFLTWDFLRLNCWVTKPTSVFLKVLADLFSKEASTCFSMVHSSGEMLMRRWSDKLLENFLCNKLISQGYFFRSICF